MNSNAFKEDSIVTCADPDEPYVKKGQINSIEQQQSFEIMEQDKKMLTERVNQQ